MNILIFASYQNDGSPSAIFVHDQAKAYINLGHRVIIITPIAWGKKNTFSNDNRFCTTQSKIDGVEYRYLRHLSLSTYGINNINTKTALAALKRYCQTNLNGFSPDVIHAHAFGLGSDGGMWLKYHFGCPLVVTTHGGDTDWALESNYRSKAKIICNQADIIVAVSGKCQKRLKQLEGKTPVLRILNGFCVENISSLHKEPLHMVQVGNLISSKHVEVTMHAIAKLRKKYPQFTLTVVGDGPERVNLEKLSKNLSLVDAVQFLGRLPNQQAMMEMARASFFCMPSYPEGFGIVYLEAMASGCVTIGTEGEGIADLIVSGENGFLVPPNNVDAIVRVIDDCLQGRADMEKIAVAGHQSAFELTWEKNAEQYIQLFKEIRGEY